jgi:hypothetical protein
MNVRSDHQIAIAENLRLPSDRLASEEEFARPRDVIRADGPEQLTGPPLSRWRTVPGVHRVIAHADSS